jgi:hypothetical protein
MDMETIQSQEQREGLGIVVEKIVQDLKNSGLFEGNLSVERVLPSAATPTNTPAGYPHLMIQEERQKKFLGLFPYNQKNIILVAKEGFYDIEDKGRKDMFVFIRAKSSETIAKKHLDRYGKENQVTEIVYK